jgi:hypothetical protein
MQLAIDYQRDEVYGLLNKLLTSADVGQQIKDAINSLIVVKDQPAS